MSDLIRIGCKVHTPEEWKNFSDSQIDNMGTGSLIWWKKWKLFIFTTHDMLVGMYEEEPTK